LKRDISGTVFDIRKYSIHDGPGIRTTVFFKGCPLSCWWCHNPEGQALKPEIMFRQSRCIQCDTCLAVCPAGAISRNDGRVTIDLEKCDLCGDCLENCYAQALELAGRTMGVDEVLAEIERDTIFYDQSGGGATFSGGEPLFQRGFLKALLVACQSRGIHTVLDTCGYASWQALDDIRDYVGLFLYDLKIMDDTLHRRYTGVSNKLILNNLQNLSGLRQRIIVRVPIIPGINDHPENLNQMAKFLSGLISLERVDLLPYHKLGFGKYTSLQKVYRLSETQPPTEEYMSDLSNLFRGFGLDVKIGA
jgi:pyruvate formate lyase activating enzyme